MGEENQKQEQEEEQSTDNTGEGNKSESLKAIEKANDAAKRLEDANAKREELLERQEGLAVENALGGRADAGQVTPKKEDEDSMDYADKIRDGEANPFKDIT